MFSRDVVDGPIGSRDGGGGGGGGRCSGSDGGGGKGLV